MNRCPTFLSGEDFAFYRSALGAALARASCTLHAYVLMTNHVHLLVTPTDTTGPADLMRSVGSRYVRYFNDRYRRSGPLWEGRYRSTPVDSDAYLLTCSRYIELNPVRANLARDPGSYAWSSYHRNAMGRDDGCVQEHLAYTALGPTRATRCSAYRAMVEQVLTSVPLATIRASQRTRPGFFRTSYEESVAALSRATSMD